MDAFLMKVKDQILDPIITVVALAAFILFVFGVVEFIAGATNEEKREAGKKHLVWGIIGLVIVFGATAIVNILKNIIAG